VIGSPAIVLDEIGRSAAQTGRSWSFGRQARAALYAQLASFEAEGITPYRALERVQRIGRARLATGDGLAGALARIRNALSPRRRALAGRLKVIRAVLKTMDQGQSLADSLKPWVPVEESEMVRTGEKSDLLGMTLRELEGLLKVKIEIANTMLGSGAAAIGRLTVLVLMMFYILNTVLKEARTLVSDELFYSLTLSPLYFRFGELFTQFVVPGTIAAVAIAAAITISLPRWRPYGLRTWLDTRLAPWSVYAQIQAATFLASSSAMMESGKQFSESLKSLAVNGSPWMRTHCRRMLRRLDQGRPDAEALQTGMIDWELEDQLGVYSMLDDFNQVMRSISRDSLQIVLKRVKRLGSLLSYASMIALGIFILLTVFSIGEIAMEARRGIQNTY